MPGPLENIKILDLTRVLAGPFCTMVLSDMGAEVIKVEIPGQGDDSRNFGPFMNDRSLYFLNINREKKSITLNLKTEKGRRLFHELICCVDVLVENFVPGTMEKLGVGYRDLNKLNSKLIYTAISGYGHSGPESKKPSYDILAQAMGGIMSITGWPDRPPTRVGISIGDITASLYAAIGITGALYERAITGKGQKVDIAMLDCQVSILENALARYQVDKVPPGPLGNRHPTITPFQAFTARDGYFVAAVGNDSIWEKFCFVINNPDLIKDNRFNTNQKRTENVEDLIPILNGVFTGEPVAHWLNLLQQAGIPCGPINTMKDIIKDKQLNSRNMILQVTDKIAGIIKIAGNPIKMETLPERKQRTSAPELGEHNKEIYQKLLNLSEDDLRELEDNGII